LTIAQPVDANPADTNSADTKPADAAQDAVEADEGAGTADRGTHPTAQEETGGLNDGRRSAEGSRRMTATPPDRADRKRKA
jgi:hypothetical protein